MLRQNDTRKNTSFITSNLNYYKNDKTQNYQNKWIYFNSHTYKYVYVYCFNLNQELFKEQVLLLNVLLQLNNCSFFVPNF